MHSHQLAARLVETAAAVVDLQTSAEVGAVHVTAEFTSLFDAGLVPDHFAAEGVVLADQFAALRLETTGPVVRLVAGRPIGTAVILRPGRGDRQRQRQARGELGGARRGSGGGGDSGVGGGIGGVGARFGGRRRVARRAPYRRRFRGKRRIDGALLGERRIDGAFLGGSAGATGNAADSGSARVSGIFGRWVCGAEAVGVVGL